MPSTQCLLRTYPYGFMFIITEDTLFYYYPEKKEGFCHLFIRTPFHDNEPLENTCLANIS